MSTEASIAALEAQVADLRVGYLHLLGEHTATMLVLTALRFALAAAGRVEEDQLRQIADALFARLDLEGSADGFTDHVRASIDLMLGDGVKAAAERTAEMPAGRLN